MSNILICGTLDEKIFLNIDFYGKEYIHEIIYKENQEMIVSCLDNIPDNFGITINNHFRFNYDDPIIIHIKLKVLDINYTGNIKYYDGKRFINDPSMIIDNEYRLHSILLDKWYPKCRLFLSNSIVKKFAIKDFNITDSKNNIIFKLKKDSPYINNHYSLVKSYFLYNEVKSIFSKHTVYMMLNSKYPINYIFDDIKYIDLNNIDEQLLNNTLYLFVTNFEYYQNMLNSAIIHRFITQKKIKLIFRSCRLPDCIDYNDGIYFLQNPSIKLPSGVISRFNNTEMTVEQYISYITMNKLQQRIFINTMGISSNTTYERLEYTDNKIHILFMGRLIRPFDIIHFINKVDTLLDHDIFIIDILPGTFTYKNKNLNPRLTQNLHLLKTLFNPTINVITPVDHCQVRTFICKSDIGIDFPSDIHSISTTGPENCKLYEYISLGLPVVSQITPNSYFITKYKCGVELNKICSPTDYYNAIMEISSNLSNMDRPSISRSFIDEYSYKNLTYKLLRNILFFYKELPRELLGNWNLSEEKIINESPYLKNHKFLIRDRTIKINWDRLLKHFPDLFRYDKKSFLDLSCGNGATLEILRFMGHTIFGVDYESSNHCFDKPLFHSNLEMNNKWPYKILLESQNLDFKGHDLNVIPYPFEDNSFDIVNSWGAIEFYGRPKYWNVFILEMLRISKEYVNIAFNDISSWLKDNNEYVSEYNTFFNEIENIFSGYNVQIAKISDRHYKFLKQGKINISYLDSSNFKVDEFISIGGECSVSEALKYLSIRNFSSPFDWIITDFNKIYNTFQSNFSIQNFLNIDDIKNINEFKGKFTTSDNVFYYHEQDCNSINDVLIKYTKRLKRLNNILNCNKSIIFILKSQNATLEEIITLEKLIIKMYSDINFKILFINPNVKTTHYSNHIIGVYLDEVHFIRWSNGTWNHGHQTNDLNEIMCNCLKDVFFKFNIDKSNPFLKDITTIYNANYVLCKYIEKEHFITIKNANKLPNNSGISFSFYKNIITATLIFLAKKITENECYLKVYTGKKWIKFDEPLEVEYKKFSIVSEFDFNAKSKWRIGFNINTDQNIDYELCLKDIKFK